MRSRLNSIKIPILLEFVWYITLISAFFGENLLPITVSGLGTIYMFRWALILTLALFVVDCIVTKKRILKDASKIIKATYLLFVFLIIYSFISMFLAIDISHTFSRGFNITLDVIFCFLGINLFPRYYKKNIIILTCTLLFLQMWGIYETIFGVVLENYEFWVDRARYDFFGLRILNTPPMSIGNPNDATSVLAMMTIIISWVLISNYYNTKNKSASYKCSLLIIFLNGATYYLAACALGDLVILAMNLHILGMIIYAVTVNKKMFQFIVWILIIVGFVHLMPNFQKYKVIVENTIAVSMHNSKDTSQDNELEEPVIKEVPKIYGETDTLAEQFVDEEGRVDPESKGGVRLTLILYCVDTFVESKGLGVGYGNTETLAARDKIIPVGEEYLQISMHAFPLRLLADMGVFLILPTIILLLTIGQKLYWLFKSKNQERIKYYIELLFSIIGFCVLTMPSSDAQDILALWIMIALIICRIDSVGDEEL